MKQRTYLDILMCLIFLFTVVACGSPSESPNTELEPEITNTSETPDYVESDASNKGAEESITEEITEDSSPSSDDIEDVDSEAIELDNSAGGGASPVDNEDSVQHISNPIDLDAQYSLDDENPFDTSGIMEQLAYSLGGGGDVRYLYDGCALIDDPSIIGSNSSSSDSRDLYPGPDSQGCICGISEGDNVDVVLENPDGLQIYTGTFQVKLGASVEHESSVYYADGTIGESYNCYEVQHDFIFIPGDPYGSYQKTVTIGENIFSGEILRTEPTHPIQYYAPRLNGYVLEGYDPYEEVTVIFYTPLETGSGAFKGDLLQAASIELDENGSALILSDNPELDLRTVRGNPTEAFFEVRAGYGTLSENPSESPFDWEVLIAQNPDNPFVYYHSGEVDRALEADPDFLLARFDRALNLLGLWDFPGLIERNSVKWLFWVNEEGNSQVRTLAYNSIHDDKLDTGIEDLTEVLALVPENVIAYLARGLIFAIQGNPDEALADFNEVINLEPNLLLGYSLKAEVEFHLLKQPEKARETINQAYLELADDPNSLAADDLAGLATTFGDIHLAIDLYSQAIELEGRDYVKSNYLIYRGYLYQQLEEYDKANIDFQNSQLLYMDMVYIPEGEFFMGTNATDSGTETAEQPKHTVALDAFYMDSTETTVYSYQLCVQAGVCKGNPSLEPLDGAVTNVSWIDAQTYCGWLGKRLPTEAEWEKASRSDDQRLYPWGNETEKLNSCEVNYNDIQDGVAYNNQLYLDDSSCFGPYGLNHAVGNVWEWTADYYDEAYYSSSPSENPQGPDSGDERVLRGGGWSTNDPNFLRVTNRWSRPEDFARDDVGFRCAMDAD